jgi:hypothetical protein
MYIPANVPAAAWIARIAGGISARTRAGDQAAENNHLTMPPSNGTRDTFLRTAVFLGVALFLGTEILGAFTLLRPIPLAIWWILVLAAGLVPIGKPHFSKPAFDPVTILALLGIAAILILTAATAAFSPPNSADAMAYHMPRVVYWAEQNSVRFFPTPYLNQIMLQPLAEYGMLHLYLFTGGDHLTNFIQWLGWLGSIVSVSLIAKHFGADGRGQSVAALLCASVPSGILASSGAKNDCFLALWIAAAVYFALEFTTTLSVIDAAFLGCATGLALLTKATAYVFLPWVLLAVFAAAARRKPIASLAGPLALTALCALAINTPHYIRNYQLSGSQLGFDSAQADGVYRWRNEAFGWKPTVSNMLRNTSEQLGQRSPRWNQRVYSAVLNLHRRLGIDPNDPATTWRGASYIAPKNANHEADSPGAWHLAIILICAVIVSMRALRSDNRLQAFYSVALAAALITFCAYLKWQPFMARLFIPVFVLASPLIGTLARSIPGRYDIAKQLILAVVCLFLLDNARHPVLDNWVRPLRGPNSVLHIDRDIQYFADMTPWKNADAFRKSVDALAASGCHTVAIDITDFQLEYPLQAMLRERNPGVTFVHTAVDNPSRVYAPPVADEPCAVVCLECVNDAARRARYSGMGKTQALDTFVVFLK